MNRLLTVPVSAAAFDAVKFAFVGTARVVDGNPPLFLTDLVDLKDSMDFLIDWNPSFVTSPPYSS